MRDLRTNTATRITVGPFLGLDGITPSVSLTVTNEYLTLVVDNAGVPTLILDVAPTASGGSNDMVHVTGDDAGFYDLELAAADVNYLGRAVLSLNNVAAHCPVFHEFQIITAMEFDRKYSTGGVNVTQIAGSTNAATNLERGTLGVVLGTVGSASTTTSIVTSSLDPAAAVTNQFLGAIITFDRATTTANLRGQRTDITGSTAGGVLSCTALTTAPVSGDTFTIC